MQLRNFINQRNISAKINVSSHVHEVEDFLNLVIWCHILGVVMHYFGMEHPSDEPKRNCEGLNRCQTAQEKWSYLKSQLHTVVEAYVIPRKFLNDKASDPSQANLEGCYNPHGTSVTCEHAYFSSAQATETPSRSLPITINNCSRNTQVAPAAIHSVAKDGVFDYASAVLND